MDGKTELSPETWAQLEPYAQLLTGLVPRAAGVELYDPAGQLRWSSGNDVSAELSSHIEPSTRRARQSPAEAGEVVSLPGVELAEFVLADRGTEFDG